MTRITVINPNTSADESQTGAPHYYVLRDRPALTGSEITDPKQNFGSLGARSVPQGAGGAIYALVIPIRLRVVAAR